MYSDYLQSTHWKDLRKHFFRSKRFTGICFICQKKFEKFNIHHKTYKWIGKEKLQNLVALCAECHHKVHFQDDKKLPLIPKILNERVYKLRTLTSL